jgi:hypothetical protein
MAEILHILNGDDTLRGFEETGLDGDTLVWREVLSEGPLSKKLDADFWQMRAEWVSKDFNSTPAQYMEWVTGELAKLNGPYDEINLWFEFDLHCQVNMLGVMQLLKQQVDLSERAIYLICPDSYPGVDDFRGMGQLNGEQLEYLFDDRIRLTEYDFQIAEEAWTAYRTNDANQLQEWVSRNPFWGSLHMLKTALEAQHKRLLINENGLSYIEQTLLSIHQSGITDRTEIYRKFWSVEKIYGMGDKELGIYLNKLGL